MNIRVVVVWIYGLTVIGGAIGLAVVHFAPRDATAFKAARALPAGHLLASGDFVAGGAPAGYLTKDVAQGATIGPADVAALPALAAKKGVVPVAFSVASATVQTGAIEAGKGVQLCKDKTAALPAAAAVRFVVCADAAAQCIAIVDIPADKADVLKTIDTLALRTGDSAKPCE